MEVDCFTLVGSEFQSLMVDIVIGVVKMQSTVLIQLRRERLREGPSLRTHT